ncbi:MAG: winged helix-turn-helix domain-containing protein [Myxococcota bacterium]|nr:winged helix-turn-helix domain-containing protein [Myxococcota bacterium]
MPRTTDLLFLEVGELDLETGVLSDATGTLARLTPKERGLLSYLSARPDEVISRESLLVDVWGYAPGVVSRAVDKTMARLRVKIERNPAEPDHLLGVHGEGYRFHARSSTAPGSQKVAPPWSRQELVAELGMQMAAAPGVWVLHGPGGVGKTWLARALQERYHTSRFVDLSTSNDSAEAEARITGVLDSAGRAAWSAACESLGDVLLVLDNTEQLESIGDIVASLTAPRLRLLVTSRHRPDYPATAVPVLPLAPEASRALLLQRAELDIDPLNAETVDAVVEWLDGLPLAIELAARRLRLCSISELRTRLDSRPGMLHDPSRSVRHQSLVSALKWSWDLLSPAAQNALAACSVFRGSFDLDAAEAVLGAADPLELLDMLSAASLISRLPESGRFRLHGAVTGFVAGEASPAVLSAATLKHAGWYALKARTWADGIRGQTSSSAWQRLDLERANLFAAFDTASASADAEVAVALSYALDPLLRTRGPTSRWIALCQSLVTLTQEASGELAGTARLHRGVQRLVGGEVRAAAADLRAALAAGRRSGEPTLTAMAAIRLAFVHGLLQEGNPAELLDEAHDLGVAHDLPRLQALALGDRGIYAWRSSDFAVAEQAFSDADRLFARTGDHVQRASTAVNRGHNARAMGSDDIAAAHFTLAVRLAEDCRYRRVSAVASLELGDIAMVRGELSRSALHFDAAFSHGIAIGSAELIGVVGVRRACLAIGHGKPALKTLQEALDKLVGIDTQAAEGSWLGLAIHAALLRRRRDPAAAGLLALARQASANPTITRVLDHPSDRIPSAHLDRGDCLRWQWVASQLADGVLA